MWKLARTTYHLLYRVAVSARIVWANHVGNAGDMPSASLRFRVSESTSEKQFADIGQACARIIEERCGENNIALDSNAQILDFGCGCGRTIVWLMRDHPKASFYGCDVDGEAIRWCQEYLKLGKFLVNAAHPPLPYDSASFDAVYCFSVFTHLNESMQDAWLDELLRVLKPGGLLIITVYGQSAARSLRSGDRLTLDANGFLHRTSRKLQGLVPHLVSHNLAFARLHRRPAVEEVRTGFVCRDPGRFAGLRARQKVRRRLELAGGAHLQYPHPCTPSPRPRRRYPAVPPGATLHPLPNLHGQRWRCHRPARTTS